MTKRGREKVPRFEMYDGARPKPIEESKQTIPVDDPKTVQVLHALADLQQRRSQLRGRGDVL